MKFRLFWLFATAGSMVNSSAADGRADPRAATRKPNIVFILADNLGYGEPGCYGGGILRGAATPRIDRLAEEGLRLLNFNVEAQCTPSRSALMTGRFAIRSGTMKVPRGGVANRLTQWEITIAELLSAQGYATGHFGKWHLGDTEGRCPTNQGFDEWYGIPNTVMDIVGRIGVPPSLVIFSEGNHLMALLSEEISGSFSSARAPGQVAPTAEWPNCVRNQTSSTA